MGYISLSVVVCRESGSHPALLYPQGTNYCLLPAWKQACLEMKEGAVLRAARTGLRERVEP